MRCLLLCAGLCGLLMIGAGCGVPPQTESKTPFELGREAAQAKDFGTAITQLSIAVNSARDYVFTLAYLELGDCYLKQAMSTEDAVLREQSLKSALEDFAKVLEQPELPVDERARALALEGKTLLARGEAKGAEGSFLKILVLELPRSELHYQLEARSELGWILLERAREARKTLETADEELLSQDGFRKAQDHFSKGLEIDGESEDCNLGKGICLHARGQNREAISYLAKCAALSEAKGSANPRGHYYLALALELQKGYQAKALEHFRKAIEQDYRQTFAPLYSHLVDVLLVYVPFEDPQFRWFLDSMLSFAGDDKSYWERVESFAGELAADTSPLRKETGTFARALARARNEKVEAAVSDALLLREKPSFLELISRIFPNRPRRPDYLYGRALTLLGAKRNADLEAFFDESIFRSPDLSVLESDYYQKTVVIEGRNVVTRWLEGRAGALTLTTQDKIDRDRTLGKARDAFQVYLERHPDDREVGMALGEVQELMEAFAGAYLSYALIAREVPDHTAAYRRIMKLHSGKLLVEKDLTEAWIVLRGYAGRDEDLRSYVHRTQVAIHSESLLYCHGCGRKGMEGDMACLECGRQIGRALERETAASK